MADIGPNRPGGIRSAEAAATVNAYRILKHASGAPAKVQHAAAASDALVGVSLFGSGEDASPMVASGEIVDYATEGEAHVEYGGTVTAGQPLTADSIGRAVTASSGNRLIGFALRSGVVGDIGSVSIKLGVF